MTFLFILIFIFFVLPYIVKFALRLFARHLQNKFYNAATGQSGNNPFGGYSNQQTDEDDEPQGYYAGKQHKKVFTKGDGEYVDFEEIKEERTTTAASDNTYYNESQVSDVKFEEIKD